MQLLSSTSSALTATALNSNVGTGIDSVWTVAIIAIGIPLAFYILKRIIGLFPKGR